MYLCIFKRCFKRLKEKMMEQILVTNKLEGS